MKHLIVILAIASISLRVYSQTECDYPDRDSAQFATLPYFGNNNYLENLLDSIGFPNGQSRLLLPPEVRFHVPVKFWVYRRNDGTGGPTSAQIQNYITQLNNFYTVQNGTSIGFYQYCEPTFVNSSASYDINTDLEAVTLIHANEVEGAINVHIVNTAVSSVGITYFSRFFDIEGILVSSGTYTNANLVSTLSHEVGHYLGLDHTHQYFNKGKCRQEAVSRTRTFPTISFCPLGGGGSSNLVISERSGDGLADTPADPELNANLSCTFNNAGNYTTRRDNWNDLYAMPPAGSNIPETGNLMSYNGSRICRTNFSRLQIGVMMDRILNRALKNEKIGWLDSRGIFDEYEYDNSVATAKNIGLGEIQERSFHQSYSRSGSSAVWSNCDIDYARFTPSCSGNYVLQTEAIIGRPNADTRIDLFNSTGQTVLASNDNISATNKFSSLTFNFVAGTTYIIKIANISTTAGGFYSLSVGKRVITGSTGICGSTANYSVSALPGASVTWSATPTGILSFNPVGPTTNLTTTATKVGTGNVTIIATVNSACGNNMVARLPVTALSAMSVNLNVNNTNYSWGANATLMVTLPHTQTYTATLSPANVPGGTTTTYTWGTPTGSAFSSFNASGNQAGFSLNTSGTSGVPITQTNSQCGSVSKTLVVLVQPSGFAEFDVSPNPSSGQINISPKKTSVSAKAAKNVKTQIFEIQIIDKTGAMKKREVYKEGKQSTNISLTQLTADVYTVRIYNGISWETHKVVKQ